MIAVLCALLIPRALCQSNGADNLLTTSVLDIDRKLSTSHTVKSVEYCSPKDDLASSEWDNIEIWVQGHMCDAVLLNEDTSDPWNSISSPNRNGARLPLEALKAKVALGQPGTPAYLKRRLPRATRCRCHGPTSQISAENPRF